MDPYSPSSNYYSDYINYKNSPSKGLGTASKGFPISPSKSEDSPSPQLKISIIQSINPIPSSLSSYYSPSVLACSVFSYYSYYSFLFYKYDNP